jgi:dTDP-4-dehydrorhamnose reductase
MKILVTGAHGLLGRSLLQQQSDAELLGCGRSSEPVAERPYYQVQLLESGAAASLLEAVRPDWVIHTAALTNVDLCETERQQARQINLDIVALLAQACAQVDAGLVQLSTDYVFDGCDGPYSESDATHALSHYGQLKLESERCVLEAPIKGLVVRTLWLYGYIVEARPNLVTWPLAALGRGEKLSIVDDQWGNPTYVDDLAAVLLQLCRSGASGLYHMGGSDFLTRYQLVLQLADFFGLDTSLIEPVSTQTAGQQAPRPLRSGLRTEALETLLYYRPLGFTAGLQQMARQASFRRAFADLG